MSKYGLVGEKLGHSLSPTIHENIFKNIEKNGEYSLYEIPRDEKIVETMLKKGVEGFNVTIPYKEKVINELDFISEEAEKIGAVNLVQIKSGKSYGYNSDYYGVIKMFEKHNIILKNKRCYILGSGGAAKSVIVALYDLGAKEIIVVTRDVVKKRRELINRFKKIEVISYEDIIGGDIIINTTPIGMYPNIDSSPVTEDIIKRFDIAVDVIYNPKKTKFLLLAEKNGLKCVNGITMLVEQAIKSEKLWQGVEIEDKVGDKIEKIIENILEEKK